MQPPVSAGRRFGQRRQHRLDEARHRSFDRALNLGGIRRLAFVRVGTWLDGCARVAGLLDPSRLGRPARRFACDLIDRPSGLDQFRPFLEEVGVSGGAGVFVVALDQEPILALLARLGAHPDQMPAAVEFLAAKLELEMALLQASVRVADRRPCSTIPDDDRATAIFALGDRSLEIGIFQRVVLDRDREPLLARNQARAAGHRPALEHAVQRQPKIVVQPGGVVLLDDEDIAALDRLASLRLGGRFEVALASIGFKRHPSPRLAPRRGGLCFCRVPPATPPFWPTIFGSAGRRRFRATPAGGSPELRSPAGAASELACPRA